MTTREKMQAFREERQLNFEKLSKKCRISAYLLSQIEKGWVTHPKIAQRIGNVYGLSEEETWELMPEIHRPNHPRYDPDHYKSPIDKDDENARYFKIPPRREDLDGLWILDDYHSAGKYNKKKGAYYGAYKYT